MSYFFRKETKIWQLVKPISEKRNNQGRINSTDVFEEEDKKNPSELWLCAKMMISQRLAQNATEPQMLKMIEKLVPKQYMKYRKVFEQQALKQLPRYKK